MVMGSRIDRLSTYFVQDRSNQEELTRLILQDQMITHSMGGVLVEQSDPGIFRRVLDVACGSGGWLIETAKTYPHIQTLIGVDSSKTIRRYATALARAEQVDTRVTFEAMDALFPLAFPPDSFDLVNQRFGVSYLRTWEWPKLLADFQRVARPGGIIRLTEGPLIDSTSPAQMRIKDITLEAFLRAGNLFPDADDGLRSSILCLMEDCHFQNVQTRVHTLTYRAGTPEGQTFREDMVHLARTVLPFVKKWGQVPADYEAIYQQMLMEMQQPDFVATWTLYTIWGTNPPKE
jgi:ubiquinone/menaquinone biosynthesis C-methylase UbiE